MGRPLELFPLDCDLLGAVCPYSHTVWMEESFPERVKARTAEQAHCGSHEQIKRKVM